MNKVDKIKTMIELNLYKSVIRINENISLESKEKVEDYLTFGVKNTNDIPKELFEKIRKNDKFLWTTVDKMSHIGRSIDTDLINPLTYRVMTGSTSGGPINIIKGINDFAIGTDGGGSVLAPALSCNLYSAIGSGLGLLVDNESLSTDKITFNAGIGFISKRFDDLKNIIEFVIDETLTLNTSEVIKIGIPKGESLKLPDGRDMNNIIKEYLNEILNDKKLKFVEKDFGNIFNREDSINAIKENLYVDTEDKVDIILTFEGPIDVYGYDETIQRSFNGIVEKQITSNGGKGIVKSANMCKCTAITIPTDNLACGFVITAAEGIENARKAFYLASKISSVIITPEIFNRYFLYNAKFVKSFENDK